MLQILQQMNQRDHGSSKYEHSERNETTVITKTCRVRPTFNQLKLDCGATHIFYKIGSTNLSQQLTSN